MNPIARFLSERLPLRWQRSVGSLRTQLVFWNVVALSLLLGALGVTCRYITLSFMMQSVNQELERGIEMFMRRPPPGPPRFERGRPPGPEGPPDPNRPRDDRRRSRPPDANNPFRPHLFNADGTSEMSNDTRPVWDAEALARALRGETLRTTVMVDEEPVYVLSAPKPDRRGGMGAVQNAYPLKEVYRAISGINTALLLLIPVGLLCAGWMGSALTSRILRRVQRMTQAAGRIGAEDFARRLPVSGNDEFSELAETFNGLLERLDRAYQEQKRVLELQRRFTADASHELKTPLTIVKGSTSLALGRASTDEGARHTFREIDAAADTMSQLVQDLLLLARSDGGQMARNPIEILVREVLETARAQAVQNGGPPITLKVEPEGLSVTGNEEELIRLFRNVLDNAVRYTPAEGHITVTACASKGQVQVTVEDTGSGIAPEHLPHLGERFYRVDTSRTRPTGGTGLGLSICQSIVEAHRGTLTFQSVLGTGTTVQVILPGLR